MVEAHRPADAVDLGVEAHPAQRDRRLIAGKSAADHRAAPGDQDVLDHRRLAPDVDGLAEADRVVPGPLLLELERVVGIEALDVEVLARNLGVAETKPP